MPRGDGTGPEGRGPQTGRGLGYCSGHDTPGFTKGAPRGGRGFGRNRGRGRGIGPVRSTRRITSDSKGVSQENDSSLRNAVESLESKIDSLKDRLDELED